MRKKTAAKNSIIGLTSKLVTMVLSMVSMKIFTRELGIEIRGLNSVFANCLSLLQLTELGIGSAIIYALYKPLAEDNSKEIQILMNLYKKIYRYIGITVVCLGIGLSFFIEFFVTDTQYSKEYLLLIFFIQLISSASTYFLAYKRNLIYADQKMYVNTLIDMMCYIVATIVRIVIMLTVKSYVAYLLVQVVQTIVSNLLINYWCNKQYPYLKEKVAEAYDKIDELKNNVKNLIVGKISGLVYSSTDNLIISKCVGILQVGYMAGYYDIVNILKMLSSSITEPIQPILGNLVQVEKEKKKVLDVFLTCTFIRYCIANIITVGAVVMLNPVIQLWLGKEFVLMRSISMLMAIDMFIAIVHGPTGEMISVLGLFQKDKIISIIGMLINLGFSIALVFKLGVVGVLIGTVLAQSFYWLSRGFVVFQDYFKGYEKIYIKRIIQYIIVWILDVIVLGMIQSKYMLNVNIVTIIVMGCICVIVSGLSIVVCFFHTAEFREAWNLAMGVLGKRELRENDYE